MIATIMERLNGLKAFKRGIHPPHRKYTQAQPIEMFLPTRDLLLPLVQHIGAACEPTVKPKTEVKFGDKIADATAFVTAPIHATINGTTGASAVTAIPGGRRVPAIPLKPAAEGGLLPDNFLASFLDRNWGDVEPTKFDPDEICNKIREGGLVGLGGATFPTHIKLKRNPKKPIDTLVLNGCECEPYLTADHRMMVEVPEAIVVGMQLAAHAAGVKKTIIAIEANKPDAIEAMKKAIAGRPNMEIAVCATKYPMGGERQLIAAVTGRTVPSAPRGLPLDVGVVVCNVATAHSIARAVARDLPLTHRVVTVTGRGVNKPGNYLTPIGTMISELI
ncbi:MAG: RnfABCDGE type electron transport complex subunit C, partial [Phycisphaerae bacterium]|nr:RnfABCDGE type electron transport complex subunit C [Phycisphaerae bacterium]